MTSTQPYVVDKGLVKSPFINTTTELKKEVKELSKKELNSTFDHNLINITNNANKTEFKFRENDKIKGLYLLTIDNSSSNYTNSSNQETNILIEEYKQNKQIHELLNMTIAMNNNMQQNFNLLLNEIVKLKQENLELKKQSIDIQNDIKPFLKSILDMQLYSFNNINTYKTAITKITKGMNDYKNKFFNDISEIKEYLNRTLTGNHEDDNKENVFSEALKEKAKGKNGKGKGRRFLENSSKISLSLKKNSNSKTYNKKDLSFFDP